MIIRSYLAVVVILVIVFFVGLNIGIHGYFVLFHQTHCWGHQKRGGH